MNLAQIITRALIDGGSRAICKIMDEDLARIPDRGPLILVANHINFLDAPLIFARLLPRPVTGFAKIETWDNPLIGWLFSTWKAIPIRRGEADLEAMQAAEDALAHGQIIAMAPEGTRSGNGQMQKGRPGIVMLALRSGAPIMPMAHYGGETLWRNLKHLRRTPFHILVGRPFKLILDHAYPDRQERQSLTDEIMLEVANLLPASYRGYYASLSKPVDTHLAYQTEGINLSLTNTNYENWMKNPS